MQLNVEMEVKGHFLMNVISHCLHEVSINMKKDYVKCLRNEISSMLG